MDDAGSLLGDNLEAATAFEAQRGNPSTCNHRISAQSARPTPPLSPACLRHRTREKVSILGTNYLETMEKDIDISQIPPDYGGRSGRAMDDSDDERKVMYDWSVVDRWGNGRLSTHQPTSLENWLHAR